MRLCGSTGCGVVLVVLVVLVVWLYRLYITIMASNTKLTMDHDREIAELRSPLR